MSFLKKPILALVVMCSVLHSHSQTVTSPYSIIGVGDVENRNTGRTAGMASVSAAMRTTFNINTLNPASITAMPLHLFLFEVAGKGRSSRFRQPGVDTISKASTDFAFKRVSLAFKATKNMAFGLGLQPFSTTNYSFSSILSVGAGTAADVYERTVTGIGSMQELYFTQAYEFGKQDDLRRHDSVGHLSLGYTFSYLFGSVHQDLNYYNPFFNLNVTKQNSSYLRNPRLKFGAQYYSADNKAVQHRFGAFATLPVNLNVRNSYNITDGSTIVQDTVNLSNSSFKIPLMVTAGYSVTFNHKLTIAADYNFQQWKTQSYTVSGVNLAPSNRISLGAELVNNLQYAGQYFEKNYLQAGIFYENTYWQANNSRVNDFGVTFGGGTNFNKIHVFAGLELGVRGNTSKGQIQEIYQQLTIGVSFWDRWEKSGNLKYY